MKLLPIALFAALMVCVQAAWTNYTFYDNFQSNGVSTGGVGNFWYRLVPDTHGAFNYSISFNPATQTWTSTLASGLSISRSNNSANPALDNNESIQVVKGSSYIPTLSWCAKIATTINYYIGALGTTATTYIINTTNISSTDPTGGGAGDWIYNTWTANFTTIKKNSSIAMSPGTCISLFSNNNQIWVYNFTVEVYTGNTDPNLISNWTMEDASASGVTDSGYYRFNLVPFATNSVPNKDSNAIEQNYSINTSWMSAGYNAANKLLKTDNVPAFDVNNSAGNFSILLWANITSMSAQGPTFISKTYSGDTEEYILGGLPNSGNDPYGNPYVNQLVFSMGNWTGAACQRIVGVNWAQGNGPPTLNTWHLIAGVYNGTNVNLYLDGKLNGTQKAQGPRCAGTAVSGSQPAIIGGWCYGGNTCGDPGSPFDIAQMDAIKFYNRTLTEAEIAAEYNQLLGWETGAAVSWDRVATNTYTEGEVANITVNFTILRAGFITANLTWFDWNNTNYSISKTQYLATGSQQISFFPVIGEVNNTVGAYVFQNFTINATGNGVNQFDYGPHNFTTYRMQVTNCSAPSTVQYINYSVWNESDGTPLNLTTLQITETVYSQKNTAFSRSYSFTLNTTLANFNATCIFPAWQNYSISHYIVYSRNGYLQRTFVSGPSNYSNQSQNLTLYTIPFGLASEVDFILKDYSGSTISGYTFQTIGTPGLIAPSPRNTNDENAAINELAISRSLVG